MQTRPFPLERLGLAAAPEHGLGAGEVEARRARFGRNDVVEPARHPWWGLLRETVTDPMLWFLVVTSALYAAIGETLEAATLALAIVPLAVMDVYLHHRTAASTEGLRSRIAARARVRRGGRLVEVAAAEVVPGDVAVVAAGELVPADGVVLAGEGLQLDESALSGESVPVRKHVLAWPPGGGDEPPVAVDHWLYAGTRVLAGRGDLCIAYTGGETLYGAIVRSAVADGTVRTPAQRSIARLVGILTAVAATACVVLAAVRWSQGHGWVDAVMSGLTLAVAALPEEFPVVFTCFLGVGVYRLARRRALVRRAAAVEHIGRVTTICSDKTGTLTEGRLALAHLVPGPDVTEDDLVAFAAAASRAESGDPLDAAVIAARATRTPTSAVGTDFLADTPSRLATYPFTEDRKRETAVVRDDRPALLVVTKGALETLLAMTAADAATKASWTAQASSLARDGHKVIACAHRALDPSEWSGTEPTEGFRLSGLLAFEDPVRPGVAAAVGRCRDAGIRTIMVTGDHPLTALAVAREIGLGGGAPVVTTGDEIASALAAGDTAALATVDVVARAMPAQKLALVRALQDAGEIVAVTGDGVNDVPALKRADVGIAMGERGTQSAREVASVVLLDDDFATIVAAIAEGRQLFHNLKLSFRYLLMIHMPLVVTAALLPLAGYPLLYLPIHVVWLELVIHPTALLAFQGSARAAELQPVVRAPAPGFFERAEWLGVVIVGTALTMLVAGSFLGALDEGSEVAHARAIALVTLCGASAALAAAASALRTRAARGVVAATLMSVLIPVQWPALARHLHVTPLHYDDLGAALLASLVVTSLAFLVARYADRLQEGDRRPNDGSSIVGAAARCLEETP